MSTPHSMMPQVGLLTASATPNNDLEALVAEARHVLGEALALRSASSNPEDAQKLKSLVDRFAGLSHRPVRFRPDKAFRDQVEDAEREIILGALKYTKDNATEAARLLDLERGHFYKKMKSLGLKRSGGETINTVPAEPMAVPAPRPSA